MINKNLFNVFNEYIELIVFSLKNNRNNKIQHLNLIDNIIQRFEEFERGEKFSCLVDETMKIDSPYLKSQIFPHHKSFWESSIKNFFRRSSCYIDIQNNQTINTEELFQKYIRAFSNEGCEIYYLALVELVDFYKNEIDCGSFKICRFNEIELNSLFSTSVAKYFYKNALIDTNQFRNYWFICVSHYEKHEEFSWDVDNKIKFHHSMFPERVELALKKLSLFEWYSDVYESWHAPQISYIFKVNNNLLQAPSPVNFDYKSLMVKPSFDNDLNDVIEIPITIINFSKVEVENLEKFLVAIEHIFDKIGKTISNINFIENSLGYFIKAFLSQDFEQLLWHISTVEGLLGDKNPGLTSTLARRAALIFAKEHTERKDINSKFKKIYNFRSNLVHGNPNIDQNELDASHLNDARKISRSVLLWFLHYVSNNAEKFNNKKSDKIKKEITDTIDLEPEKIPYY